MKTTESGEEREGFNMSGVMEKQNISGLEIVISS